MQDVFDFSSRCGCEGVQPAGALPLVRTGALTPPSHYPQDVNHELS